MTPKTARGPILCTCGHAMSSHRQDPVEVWATEACKSCECRAFYNVWDARRQEWWDEDDEDAMAASNFI